MKDLEKTENFEQVEQNAKQKETWWDKFKKNLENEPQAQKLIEAVDKADKLSTKKALDKAIAEIENSKFLQKKGNEFIRLEFEKKLRTIQKRIERKISENFGSLIKYLREQKGLSLQALGDMSGISPSYIHRIEKGERNAPTVTIIKQLADALDVSFSELLKVAKVHIDEYESQEVEELEKVILANNVAYSGKTEAIEKKEKEALVKLINSIVNLEWSEKSKHLEAIEIINLIDQYKRIQKS